MADPTSVGVLNDISHRRYNILRGTHVLVSPHRTKRPWQGQQESPSKTELPAYDPACYLCPGNKRAQGNHNPEYSGPFVFVNDYSAVREEQAAYVPSENDLARIFLSATPVTGRCYVLAFSPAHNRTLADLPRRAIERIVAAWTELYAAHVAPSSPLRPSPHFPILDASTAAGRATPPAGRGSGADTTDLGLESESVMQASGLAPPRHQYRYMQIFENKGAAMGCSNPHPHGQVWTTSVLPEEPAAELAQLMRYRRERRAAATTTTTTTTMTTEAGGRQGQAPAKNMLADYAALELGQHTRLVHANAAFAVICPWWAVWPFETLIIARAHRRALTDLSAEERGLLAEAIADVTRRYDNLFQTHFPYSMGLHQAPLDGQAGDEETEAAHLHLHFYPPLLRSATVRKFLVGYEMLAEPQRDITPEQAAARLRDCGGELYRRVT